MGFLQRGVGFHYLSASVYIYLAGLKVEDIYVNVAEVAPEAQHILSQIAEL